MSLMRNLVVEKTLIRQPLFIGHDTVKLRGCEALKPVELAHWKFMVGQIAANQVYCANSAQAKSPGFALGEWTSQTVL